MSSAEQSLAAEKSRRRYPFSARSAAGFVASGDVLVTFAASFFAEFTYAGVFGAPHIEVARAFAVAAAVISILLPVLHIRGLYTLEALVSVWRQIVHVLCFWLAIFFFLAALVFALKIGSAFSRMAITYFVVGGGVLLVAQRIFFGRILKKASMEGALRGPSIALIECCELDSAITGHELQRFGFNVARKFHIPLDPTTAEVEAVSEQALAMIRGSDIEEVFITADCSSLRYARPILQRLSVAPLPVRLVLNERTTHLLAHNPQRVGKLATFEIQRAPLGWTERACKRGFDVAVASTALVLLSPLLLMVAAAVKLDSPGPAFFRQRRKGFNGRSFRIFKFRSMTVMEDGAQVVQASRNDARVTRVGRWLRKTSVDELPQLLNVLLGDMSIIGPRPHAISHDDYYSAALADYAFRQHVKPGITGWAQVHGFRGETATVDLMHQRIQHDLWYVNHWSFWLDLTIIFRTVFEMAKTRNVY